MGTPVTRPTVRAGIAHLAGQRRGRAAPRRGPRPDPPGRPSEAWPPASPSSPTTASDPGAASTELSSDPDHRLRRARSLAGRLDRDCGECTARRRHRRPWRGLQGARSPSSCSGCTRRSSTPRLTLYDALRRGSSPRDERVRYYEEMKTLGEAYAIPRAVDARRLRRLPPLPGFDARRTAYGSPRRPATSQTSSCDPISHRWHGPRVELLRLVTVGTLPAGLRDELGLELGSRPRARARGLAAGGPPAGARCCPRCSTASRARATGSSA